MAKKALGNRRYTMLATAKSDIRDAFSRSEASEVERRAFEWLGCLRGLYGKGEFVVVLGEYLGDSVYGLSLTASLKRKIGKEKLVLICCSCYEWLLSLYDAPDEIVMLDPGPEYAGARAFLWCRRAVEEGARMGVYGASPYCFKAPPFVGRRDYRDGLTIVKDRMGLSPGVVPEAPNVPPDRLAMRALCGASPEKVVVLNPYSRTSRNITAGFFRKLPKLLSAWGYSVFTNCVGDQRPLPGTSRLECDCLGFYSICTEIEAVISIRSGILDFVLSSGVKIFAVSTFGEDFFDHYRLEAWGRDDGVCEVLALHPDDEHEVVEAFLAWSAKHLSLFDSSKGFELIELPD